MKITIVSPPSRGVATGNRCTAQQWAAMLEDLGEIVAVCESWTAEDDCDVLVALHAVKSHESIARFRSARPEGKLVVALTGTDIYPSPSEEALDSMKLADRLVFLQDKALECVPEEFHGKSQVIVQSSKKSGDPEVLRTTDPFDVCVAGHLRDVKDPMRAAEASRLLPKESKIRILQVGAILDEKYQELVDRELKENPRYQWLGELGSDELKQLMARCQIIVVSSHAEGGARVAGESIVEGTPVIGTRIDGLVGLLGDDYPGFFEVGYTEGLAELLSRSEQDPEFLHDLREHALRIAETFDPEREREAWGTLLGNLQSS